MIFLSPQVLALDRYLCNKYPDLEWCGVLFYEEEGTISDPNNYKVHVKYLYPMDVGTSGSTSIDNYEEVMYAIDQHPELDDLKQGFIHSHNSMDTFFSGTDNSQLIDGANQYDYFLSVITNNSAEYIARISFETSNEIEIGKNKHTMKEEKSVSYFDCDVTLETEEVDEFLLQRIKEIDSKRTVATYTSYKGSYLTLDDRTNTGGFMNYKPSKNEYLYLEPVEFISEQLLDMYHTSLSDPLKFDIEHVINLAEDAYEVTFKKELNEKQTQAKNRCVNELMSSLLKGYGITAETVKINRERDDPYEYYSHVLRSNIKWEIPYVSEELRATIDVSRVYDNYTRQVALHAFVGAYQALMKIHKEQPTKAGDLITMLYCSLLAHISTRSQNYKIHDVEMMQDIDLPILLDDEIIDHYSEWLPFIRAGLTHPIEYYRQYY